MQTTPSRDALMQNVGLNAADGGLVGWWVFGVDCDTRGYLLKVYIWHFPLVLCAPFFW